MCASPTVSVVRGDDQVLSHDEHTGEWGYGRVARLFRGETREVVTVTVVPQRRGRGSKHSVGKAGGGDAEDGSGLAQEIRCTPGHPWWVVGRGWIYAGDLRAGDELLGSDGSALWVERVESRRERARTFNFEVEGWHRYFVGAGGPAVLVHNSSRPSLPPRVIFENDSIRIVHNYHNLGLEHANPIHFHATYDGQEFRIRPDGSYKGPGGRTIPSKDLKAEIEKVPGLRSRLRRAETRITKVIRQEGGVAAGQVFRPAPKEELRRTPTEQEAARRAERRRQRRMQRRGTRTRRPKKGLGVRRKRPRR